MRRLESNLDLLAWFSAEERSPCPACGARACVRMHADVAAVCLACGAVWLGSEELGHARRFHPDAPPPQ